ncbi:MAG: MBL fold metallo-hydrolase [Bacillota bacterium]|nr:MBL fold metallo-hydrolase [Bacillota bacterium]
MKQWVYRQDNSLKEQVKNTVIPEEAVGIWYLGQETFLLKKGEKYLLFDPYLTDYVDHFPEFEKGFWVRRYPSPVKPELLDFIDYVLCTHDHLDHMDPDTIKGISSQNAGTQFIVPYPVQNDFAKLLTNKNTYYGAKANKELRLDDITIIPAAAAHDTFHKDSEGNFRELSYIVKWGDFTIFHGGDMMVYPGLVDFLEKFDIDVAMLPINGGDWLRDEQGIVGNINFKEAADLGTRVDADIIIPMHFDLYDVNEENPAYLVDYLYHKYPGQKYHIFQPGERMVYYKEL